METNLSPLSPMSPRVKPPPPKAPTRPRGGGLLAQQLLPQLLAQGGAGVGGQGADQGQGRHLGDLVVGGEGLGLGVGAAWGWWGLGLVGLGAWGGGWRRGGGPVFVFGLGCPFFFSDVVSTF